MHRIKSLLSAIVVALVLVASIDYVASAATGKPFLLGKVNKAKKTTTLQAKKGAALKLVTKPGKPPLEVNRDTLVKNLNADEVDGKSASELGVRTRVALFTLAGAGVNSVTHTIPDVAAGEYLVNYTLWLYLNANTGGYCHIYLTGDDEYTGYSSTGPRGDGFFPLSGNTVVKLDSTQDVDFRCTFTGATGVSTYETVKVAFTKIDTPAGDLLPKLSKNELAKKKLTNAPDA